MQFPKKRSIVFRRNPFIFEAGVLSMTTKAVYRYSGITSIWSVFSNTSNIPGRPKPSEKSDLCCVFFSRYSELCTKLHLVPTADINQSIDMYFYVLLSTGTLISFNTEWHRNEFQLSSLRGRCFFIQIPNW